VDEEEIDRMRSFACRKFAARVDRHRRSKAQPRRDFLERSGLAFGARDEECAAAVEHCEAGSSEARMATLAAAETPDRAGLPLREKPLASE